MAQSLKKNFVFNIINTVSTLLFPIITFPYAARIIMPEGIGLVQFYNSIISYIVLLSSLGIPMYGIREIARVKDNIKDLSRTTIEIISLNLLLNVLAYVVIFILCLTVAKVQANIPLFLILSLSIVLTTIGCPWFYTGVEDFKYVTVLGLIVKILCAVFLFCFVKSEADLLIYGVYTVLGSIGNYLINFFHLRKYINIRAFSLKEINIWRHLKPALAIFVFNIITSIYINLDTVMLGFLKDSSAVGYYTGATKISHILVTLVCSFGTVLLPRSSNLIKNNQMDEFYRLSEKSYSLISLVSFPICAGAIVLAPAIINIFCGTSFAPSILTLRLISPIIIVLAMSNLIGIQMLYPLGLIKLVNISTCIGALTNFTLNLILIPIYSQFGAAIATVVAETSVTASQIVLAKKYIPFKLFSKQLIGYFVSSGIMAVVCFITMNMFSSDWVKIFVVPAVGIVIYLALMLLQRDNLTRETIQIIKTRFIKTSNNE